MKSSFVLKDYNRCQGRTQPEMFSPTPSTLALKTMLAVSSHDKNDPESNHITFSIDVHTAFLHADVIKTCSQNHQNHMSGMTRD